MNWLKNLYWRWRKWRFYRRTGFTWEQGLIIVDELSRVQMYSARQVVDALMALVHVES